jgi:Na+/phosphate symporter
MKRTSKIYESVISGLAKQDAQKLKKSKKQIAKLEAEVEDLRNHLFYFIKNLHETSVRGSNFYITVLAYLTDVAQSLEYIAKKSYKHVDHNHKPLRYNQIKDLQEIQAFISELLTKIEKIFSDKDFKQLELVLKSRKEALDLISTKIDEQISRTRTEESSPKNTTLYFNLLLETKDLVKSVMNVSEEYHTSAKN